MSSTKFTDSQLKLLYGNLLQHYQQCSETFGQDAYAIYNEMFKDIQHAIEAPEGVFFALNREEKDKIYHYFNTLFYALPIYSEMPRPAQLTFSPQRPQYNPNAPRVIIVQNRYSNDTFLVNWLLLNSLTHHCHYDHQRGGSYPFPSENNRHGHPSTQDKNSRRNNGSRGDAGQGLALLVVIGLALAAIIAAFIALAYMLNEFLDSCERFYFNEGWLKAALMMASAVGFGAGSSVLSLTFGSIPLIALALLAGLNPVGVVIVGVTCLSIIGAGMGAFAMGMFYDFVDSKVHSDSMDPEQAARFRLTASEERALAARNIDPAKVKLAMIAVRAEMAEVLKNEKESPYLWNKLKITKVDKGIPSFLWRKLGRGEKVSKLLDQVRQLRSGELNNIKVGQLSFNLINTTFPQAQYTCAGATSTTGQPAIQPFPVPRLDNGPSEAIDTFAYNSN